MALRPVSTMSDKQEWYNREGRRWEFVMTMTTKHKHTKPNFEYNGTSRPHEPITMYHKSRPHQHHEPRTTRTASSQTRNNEHRHQHHELRTTWTVSTRARNDERGHQHHEPRTTRVAITWAHNDKWGQSNTGPTTLECTSTTNDPSTLSAKINTRSQTHLKRESVRKRDQETIRTSKWQGKGRSIETLKLKLEEDEKELIRSKPKRK